MAVTPEERTFLLDQVNQQASNDLRSLWDRATELETVAFAALMVDAFPQIADPYVAVASSLAADWFELSAPTSPYIAVTAPPIPLEKLTSSAEWALGAPGDKALDRMQGTLQRSVFDGARDTIVLNVERTSSRWIRHAQPDACAFCRMLATRGAVYRSASSATDVVGRSIDLTQADQRAITLGLTTREDALRQRESYSRGRRKGQARARPLRGTRKRGDRYHDHCRCLSVEIRQGQDLYDVVDSDYLNRIDQWEAEYKQAFADVPDGDTGGAKSVLAAWRKRYPAVR